MATQTFQVTYEDGTSGEFKVKPRHLIAYEDEVGGNLEDAQSVRDAFKLAWIASGSALHFDEWIETVDSIETTGSAPAAEVAVDGGPAETVPTESPSPA